MTIGRKEGNTIRLTERNVSRRHAKLLKKNGAIEIEDSNGNAVKLETSGITVNASAKVTVQASLVEVSASMVTVDAGMSKFSGVVKADTVICNSIISASYTPGAGNIW